ncbi:hypothetical protein PMAYCL1PPCAC_08344, partial [Pristionchus mayeri]
FQNSLIEGHLTLMKSPLFPSSLFSSFDEESRETAEFCQAFRRLSTANTQNLVGESGIKIDQPTALIDIPSLSWIESLPWPALNRLFHFLHNKAESTDLANLSKVSSHIQNEVMEFVKRDNNHPGFKRVMLIKTWDALLVEFALYQE